MVQPARERRQYPRAQVDIPATLYLQASDDMRRSCRIFSLGPGGVGINLATLEPLPVEASHQVRFELPSRAEALYFDCIIVSAYEDKDAQGQIVHLAFTSPRPGAQDAVFNYLQNRKRYDQAAFRVAIPVSMEAQQGLRQFVPYKGTTVEAGRQYALCDIAKFGLTVSSEVVATFSGPRFRDDELFLTAKVTKVDHNRLGGGYRVRIDFSQANDQMLDFIRRYYQAKAKPVTINA